MLALGAFALGQADVARAADANPPERMTYQGYLVDVNGDALGNLAPTNYDTVFRVYAAKQGGTALWAEQQTITVDKGYFSVLLGEGSQYGSELHGDLSDAFDGLDASDRFIGITVDVGGVATEITPRLRLVASPYAFMASQARRLTDGSGNSNFFKDDTSLKLGAGSTPTLTLPEAGGASLVGKLTVNLTGWGVGLQVVNGEVSTTFGAEDSSVFHFNTGLPGFYFNKEITVDGDIHSYNTDTILGPSDNTDTYLKVYNDSSDKITAQADEFLVQGDNNYLQTKFTSDKVELHTDAGSVFVNKPLSVGGTLDVAGAINATGNVTVTGAINATGNVTRNDQPLVRVDVLAENKTGNSVLMSDAFTVTGDPVMLFISGSTYNTYVLGGLSKLQVSVFEHAPTAAPVVVDTFEISQYHNYFSGWGVSSSAVHRAFAPINRKMKNLVRGTSYYILIVADSHTVFDINDPFHIVVTQYNNQ